MRTILLIAGAALAAVLVGCSSSGDDPPAADRSPTSSSVSQVSQVDDKTLIECSNVERAYNAWEWTSTSSMDWTEANVERRHDDGEDFLKAVEGYTDLPALTLAKEIAEYNVQMNLVLLAYLGEGSADTAPAEAELDQVKDAYAAFQDQTCS